MRTKITMHRISFSHTRIVFELKRYVTDNYMLDLDKHYPQAEMKGGYICCLRRYKILMVLPRACRRVDHCWMHRGNYKSGSYFSANHYSTKIGLVNMAIKVVLVFSCDIFVCFVLIVVGHTPKYFVATVIASCLLV